MLLLLLLLGLHWSLLALVSCRFLCNKGANFAHICNHEMSPASHQKPYCAAPAVAAAAAAARSALELVSTGQLEAAFKKGAKDLPHWWNPQLDVGLVAGVVTHGYGNWGPMFEVGYTHLCEQPIFCYFAGWLHPVQSTLSLLSNRW